MSNAVVTDWPSGSGNAGWPQEPTGMLMPGRVQGWPAGTQRAANAAERLLSQAVAWWDVGQYRDGDRFLRNRGTGGELLDLRLGSAATANSNDPRYLAPDPSGGYVYAPGGTFNWLEVPDENALDIVGDIDVRARVALDSWGPSGFRSLVTKRTFTGDQYSWFFSTDPDRYLRWAHSANGSTAVISVISTATVPFADGEAGWVRVTVDVDNGASGNDVKFFTSYDGVTWTQLGNTITTAGVTSIFSGTAPVRVMYFSGDGSSTIGKVYRAQVLNGIGGTTVLDIDCDAITSGAATSFAALTGQTVTINRSATGRKCVAVPRGGQPVFLLGTDDYMEVQDNWQHGLLNFGQGQSFTVLLVNRQPSITISQVMLAKKSGAGASNPGYLLRNAASGTGVGFLASDGVNGGGAGTSANRVAGTLDVLVAAWPGDTDAGVVYVNRVAGAAGTTAVGSLATSELLRVGRPGTVGTAYADFEFYTAAIFRRALTAAEITLLSNYFTGRIA